MGSRSAIPIPAEADKIDGSGKWMAPTPIDACDRSRAGSDGARLHARGGAAAVGGFAARKIRVVYLAKSAPEVAEAAIEAARGVDIAVLPQIATPRGGPVPGGSRSAGLHWNDRRHGGSRRRDFWRIFATCGSGFAPALVSAGAAVETAKRNTRRLFQAGVPIAAATRGGDLQRELELLVEAGLPPLDAIVAATRNSAELLRISDQVGTIAPRKRADLLVLSANPGEDVRNMRKVSLRLKAGEWVK